MCRSSRYLKLVVGDFEIISLVLISPVQSSFWSFSGCMNQTFKNYLGQSNSKHETQTIQTTNCSKHDKATFHSISYWVAFVVLVVECVYSFG